VTSPRRLVIEAGMAVVVSVSLIVAALCVANATPIVPDEPIQVLVSKQELDELRFIARMQKQSPNCIRMWVHS
jgi:Flp pilus assembly protein CpaB